MTNSMISSPSPYAAYLRELRRYDVKLTFAEMATLTAAADAQLFGDDVPAVKAAEALLGDLRGTRFEPSAVDELTALLAAIEPVAALAAV
jgi:hypothetical protein